MRRYGKIFLVILLMVLFDVVCVGQELSAIFGGQVFLAQVPGRKPVEKSSAGATQPDRVSKVQETVHPPEAKPERILDAIIDVNTKYSYIAIAVAGLTSVLVLLILVRMGGVRNSIGKIERDVMHIKEALRYLMENAQNLPSPEAKEKASRVAAAPDSAGYSAALLKVFAELELLSRKIDSFPRPATSGNKQLFSEDEVRREVERRLGEMRIETIVPAPGDMFDAVLHEEVDVKSGRADEDGTIFRVIQNGLVYNSRVALKARVVVNRV